VTQRAARFTVLDDTEENSEKADYIVLDIPVNQIDAVFKKVQELKLIADALRSEGKDVSGDWTILFHVEPHHQMYVGKVKADGSPPDVSYPPSLLHDDIPRDES